jgi:collagenase-like PrtC family protease
MVEFSVPYNNDPEALREILSLKQVGENRIREIYLSGPQEYAGSGRITAELSMSQFADVVRQIHEHGIRVNLLLNATCEGADWYSPESLSTRMEYLGHAHLELGVEAVTIANPLYISQVRSRFPDLEISASVLGDIDCVQRAVIFSRAGAHVITPDVNINRNLEMLIAIKAAGGAELKLMVNEGCLYKCPFRKFHFNYISHKSRELGPVESDIFFGNCTRLTYGDPSQIFRSCWIRPEDTAKYAGVSTFFKIVGRTRPKSFLVRTVRAYMQQVWEGNLLEILCSSLNQYALENGAHLDNLALDEAGFFEKVTSNQGKFDEDSYYSDLVNGLIRFHVLTRGILEDLGLEEMADELERQGKLPVDAGALGW